MNTTALAGIARIGAAVLAAGITAALIGCASAEEPRPVPADESAQQSEFAGELTVYAAASLEPAFEQIGDWFVDERPDVSISFSYDGSSVLATQNLSGAPVDVFASADAPNMAKITDGELAEGAPIAFATSELAIAVAPGNPLGIETLTDLASADGAPVVVICAEEVPCGNASRTLLERDGVDLEPASEEQNVTAVLTKVREGEADAGLVYLSDILRADGEVEGITIEDAADAAGDYLIVPISDSAEPEVSAAFSEYLLEARAQQLFAQLGFGPAR